MNNNIKEQIRAKLIAQCEDICRKLLPNGKKKAKHWVCGNVQGDTGESLKVDLEKGLWYDHAEGHGGDMLGLWAESKGLTFVEALHEAARHVGITSIQPFSTPSKPKGYSIDEIGSMRQTPVMRHLNARGLKESVLQEYFVRTHDRKSPHNEHFIAYQYFTPEGKRAFLKSTGINRTAKGSKDTIMSKDPWLTLWGWKTVKPRHTECCITEGEEDAMSLRQMLGLNDIPCLSLPNGTQGDSWVEHDFTAMQQFDKIYLFLDNDGPGEAGAKKLAERLGRSRCYRVTLPEGYKDSNDVLTKAPASAHTPLQWLEKATTYDPEPLKKTEAIAEATIQMRIERRKFDGGSFAWNVPFTQIPGECTILQGFTGHGKSICAYQMANHDIEAGKRVLFVSMEIPAEQVFENMCQQWVGRFPKDEDIRSFSAWLGGKMLSIDNEEDSMNWNVLKGYIEYVSARFGVNCVYLDSLHFFANKGDYEAQDKIAVDIKKLAAKHKMHITLIAHSRYGEGGEYRIPPIDGVEGSKGVLKPFHNILTHWRNVKKEEVLEEGAGHPDWCKMADAEDAVLWCSKQRNGFKKRFKQKLWFSFDSMSFRTDEIAKTKTITQKEINDELNPF